LYIIYNTKRKGGNTDMASDIFGVFFRELRLGRGHTLRSFCAAFGEDPAYISRLETGILEPPKDKGVLNRLACALQLEEGSDAWEEFHHLAAIGAKRIPEGIAENEELMKHLPVFFRTIAGEKFPDEKLPELIDYIRRVYTEGGE
jgi:transcriptional regulator with XRE-family HTH domain